MEDPCRAEAPSVIPLRLPERKLPAVIPPDRERAALWSVLNCRAVSKLS